MQSAIERFDELHDYVTAGKPSGLEGTSCGIVITGDSDGAQSIIGNLCNFFNGVGLLIAPYATLSVLWDKQAKDEKPPRAALLSKYEWGDAKRAEKMIRQLLSYART
jgi:hypothetical protein